ncbi:hypothetical protein Tco_0386819 [Tanacetum coccineum]
MGIERFGIPEGADDFIVYYDAQSKDLKACLAKGRRIEHEAKVMEGCLFSEFDFEAKYHLGKASVDVVPWSEKFKAKTTMGKENMKEPVPHDLLVVQTYVPLTSLLGSPYRNHETICASGIPEEIQEDDGDMNDSCDITVEDVEKVRKILTPSIYTLPNLEPIVQPYMPLGVVCHKAKVVREEEHDYDIPLQDHVMQPLTPQSVHITPPDNDYVAPTTNLILNKHLNESREEFADPVNDLKELLKTYDFKTFIRKLLHQLSQLSHETGKEKREIKSHQQFPLQGDGIRGLHDSFYVVEVCGVILGRSLATGKLFKIGSVGYHVDDDVGTICNDGCCSRKQT